MSSSSALGTVLGFGGLLAVGYLIHKARSAASKAINRNVLSRSEHRQGQQLVSETLRFETTASISRIKDELALNVAVASSVPAVVADLYELSRNGDWVIYAFGNKLATNFKAAVRFQDLGNVRTGQFDILNWTETDGIVSAQEVIKKLRKQVTESIRAADPSARIVEDPGNNP